MRAVLDTNILVSALISPDGAPATILSAARRGTFQLVTSPALLAELVDVLSRPRVQKFARLSDATAAEFIDGFTGYAVVTFPSITLRVVESDPADDRVVEAAVSGRADYVVSGDTDLLGLRTYQGISIVTPARFTAILTDNE